MRPRGRHSGRMPRSERRISPRRSLVVAAFLATVLVCGLAAPASAPATSVAGGQFTGSASGETLSFTVDAHNHKIREFKRGSQYLFLEQPLRIDGQTVTFGFANSVYVIRGAFSTPHNAHGVIGFIDNGRLTTFAWRAANDG
jgi:hypothetical protein